MSMLLSRFSVRAPESVHPDPDAGNAHEHGSSGALGSRFRRRYGFARSISGPSGVAWAPETACVRTGTAGRAAQRAEKQASMRKRKGTTSLASDLVLVMVCDRLG